VGIKPGVERSETPGSPTQENAESAKRPMVVAITKTPFVMIRLSAAPRASDVIDNRSWGFAALHPRLYADTRSAG